MTLRVRWAWVIAAAAWLLFVSPTAQALPSLRCETVEVVDRDGISQQMELPKLIEAMRTVPLSILPNGTPADIRIELSFFSASGRINAAIRSWAEKEPSHLQSELVPWFDDFAARRRIIKPMRAEDAQAFRQQILKALTDLVEQRTAAIALGSEPEGLPVVITSPEGLIAPLNRNRTVAVLGCLQDGAELAGYVAWPDGHRAEFRQRANQTPGRFVVGGRAATEPRPTAESPATPEEERVAESNHPPPQKEAASPRRWGFAGLALSVATAISILLWWLRRGRSAK